MIENVFNFIASVSRCSRCIKENVVTPEVDIVSHDHFHGQIHLYVMYVQRSMAGLSQAAGKWLIKNGLIENRLCKSACQGDLLRCIWYAHNFIMRTGLPICEFFWIPTCSLWGLPVCVRGSVSDVSAIFPWVTRWIRIFTCVARWIRILRMHNMHTPRPKQIAWHEIPVYIRGSRSIPVCIRGSSESPYAYGIACHAIPVCIQGSKSIPVCIRRSQRSPYAYGDHMTRNPRMHTGICVIPVCIRGYFSH